jgi:hypothetical protein
MDVHLCCVDVPAVLRDTDATRKYGTLTITTSSSRYVNGDWMFTFCWIELIHGPGDFHLKRSAEEPTVYRMQRIDHPA